MPKIKTGDIQTYYESSGIGDPIVFIHGAWVNLKMWQPQVEYFSRSYRVITYDIRGHSETGGSARRRYSMELFADDLVALVDALKLDKPSICGISMGGMVAQAYAVKYRHQLRALVLADTAVSSALTPGDKLTVTCWLRSGFSSCWSGCWG
jgi:pimeloyl-ACP methyl ester carboxylesterase